MLRKEEIGIYGAAMQLANFIPQFISALGNVAAPKFASFTTQKDMLRYLKKLQILTIILALLGL